jgi:hypothetical protein
MNHRQVVVTCSVAAAGALGCSSQAATVDAGHDARPSVEAGSHHDAGHTADSGHDAAHDASRDAMRIVEAGLDATGDAEGGDASDCAGYVYCDGFESYAAGTITNGQTLGPWLATVTGTGAVLAVSTAKAYRGANSLRVTVPTNAGEDSGTSARGSLNQKASAGLIPGNNLFGRAMVFYSNTGGDDLALGVHSWLFNSGGTSAAADGGVTMNMGGGGAKMQLNYHPPLPLTEQSVQGGAITAGAWHCVQWEYDGSGTPPNDQGQVWVDGTLALDVMKSKGWNFATPWNTFDFGFTHYEVLANGVDVYLDEFALDGAMIPCP